MNPDTTLQIIPARLEQKPVLANLLELYMHDFCDFLNVEIRDDGRFGYKELDLYWSDLDRHPFLAYVDTKLAGFALVKGVRTGPDTTIGWDMAEFFILRSFRRRGIGAGVAEAIFRKFPGSWEVRVMDSNRPAQSFWRKAIAEFTGDVVQPLRVERDGNLWHLFSFESRN